MRIRIQTWLIKFLCSDLLLRSRRWLAEQQRVLTKQGHIVKVFIKVDDPYSYVLLQTLVLFKHRYNIHLEYVIVGCLQESMFPEPELWVENAFSDAAHIADLYDLNYPEELLAQSSAVNNFVARQLLDISNDADFCERAVQILQRYWAGQIEAPAQFSDPENELAINSQLLSDMGHYFSAMLHYNGEWYWGVDRLVHLEARLNDLNLNADSQVSALVYNESTRYFCQRLRLTDQNLKRADTPLKLYFSARSPYSYLGLERAVALARHYQVPLEIKLILPMLMRNMNVPDAKKWYIVRDTKRQANLLGLNYGFIADPLGAGVERCYALYEYAKSENKAADFLLSFARAVNTEGIPSQTDAGLKTIVERSGLNWQKAQSLLDNEGWRSSVEDNFSNLYKLGLWGVPCFQYGESLVWGQDRIDVIEQAICRSISELNK